jgi:hypothetical protein
VRDLDFIQSFELECQRDGTLFGLCVWFDIDFAPRDANEPHRQIYFSTSPNFTPTHWRQSVMLFQSGGVAVRTGSRVTGELVCMKSVENPRELDVRVTYQFHSIEDQSIEGQVLTENYQLK